MVEIPGKETGAGHRKSRLFLVVTGLGVALLGFMVFFLFQHLRSLERQLTRLQNDVQESREKVREAAESSQSALARAARSEENARLAAVGRTQAEEARAEAARGQSRPGKRQPPRQSRRNWPVKKPSESAVSAKRKWSASNKHWEKSPRPSEPPLDWS